MRIAVLFLVALAFAGCHGIPGPATGPGTEMPCGALRVSCFPLDGTHTCCPEHYYCNRWGGCDADASYAPEFIGAAKSVPRESERP